MYTVDILLPTYNCEQYLGEQIESILNQSYPEIRLYIRDDGSMDGTGKLLKEFAASDKRITLIEDPTGNLGLIKNIECLLSYSKSRYIMFCDQDDVWFPNKVMEMLNIMLKQELQSEPGAPILVHSDCFITDHRLNIQGRFLGNLPARSGLRHALFTYMVQGASMMINAALKNLILPFNEYVYLHDRYIHLVSEIIGKRVYLDYPLMYYRQHQHNFLKERSLLHKISDYLSKPYYGFYTRYDRNLIQSISEKFPGNKLLNIYLDITSDKISKFRKIKLLTSSHISMKPKYLILFLIKG